MGISCMSMSHQKSPEDLAPSRPQGPHSVRPIGRLTPKASRCMGSGGGRAFCQGKGACAGASAAGPASGFLLGMTNSICCTNGRSAVAAGRLK